MYQYTFIHLLGELLGSYLTLQGCLNGNGELFMKIALACGGRGMVHHGYVNNNLTLQRPRLHRLKHGARLFVRELTPWA